MNYEEKIQELTKRIIILEKAEQKRINKRKREIIFQIIKFTLLILILLSGYIYINNKPIKPYQERIDYVDKKINNVENFLDEKWSNIINKYYPFTK